MSGPGLLYGGIAVLALAIFALAVAVMPKRREQRGVTRALATIERRYTRDTVGAGRARVGAGRAGGGAGRAGGGAGRAGGGAAPLKLPSWLPDVGARLSTAGSRTSLERRLDVAGNPAGWTPDRMLAIKAVGLVVLGVVGALLGLGHPALPFLTGLAGAVAGFFLPDVLLNNAGQKRQQRLAVSLPEALDLLTICVEAGLGFDAALAHVARNLKGPLANEFARVLQEMQIGKSRAEAMRAMAERTSVPEVRAFVSALSQSAELGIPVASVLREQAREMRVRRRQRAETQAQKIPVKMTFPLIGCLLPALFVVILGAGIIDIVHSLFHA
jgi:tight adherence protein C